MSLVVHVALGTADLRLVVLEESSMRLDTRSKSRDQVRLRLSEFDVLVSQFVPTMKGLSIYTLGYLEGLEWVGTFPDVQLFLAKVCQRDDDLVRFAIVSHEPIGIWLKVLVIGSNRCDLKSKIGLASFYK